MSGIELPLRIAPKEPINMSSLSTGVENLKSCKKPTKMAWSLSLRFSFRLISSRLYQGSSSMTVSVRESFLDRPGPNPCISIDIFFIILNKMKKAQ